MSSVRELYRHPGKGVRQAEEALTIGGRGIVGDMGYGSETRQVSLCDAAVMDALPGMDGLCARRFCPNVVTEGLDYTRLEAGRILTIGSAAFAVARVGKDCYAACERYASRGACALQRGCAFLTVTKPGEIRTGDRIPG